MQRSYSVALNLKSPSEEAYHVGTSIVYDLLKALNITNHAIISGDILAYTASGALYFTPNHVVFRPNGPLDAIRAIRFALSMAKQLEDVKTTRHGLSFNPNFIYLTVGADSEGKRIGASDFTPEAQELQKKLYGGGNFGYSEPAGLGVLLGTQEGIESSPGDKKIVELEGTSQPANSLDELLQRLGQELQ